MTNRDGRLEPHPGRSAVGFSGLSASPWKEARAELVRLPNGGLNIAYEAVDRHVERGHGARTAFRFLDREPKRREMSYAELARHVHRVANALESLGVERGQTVATLLARVPEQYLAALGALRAGAVFSPLFSSFGPELVRARLVLGEARALVTSEAFYRAKVEPVRRHLPDLEHVLLTERRDSALPADTLDFDSVVGACSDRHLVAATRPEDPALLHFTSGTTGTPKGAVHVHEAVVGHLATARLALGVEPGDVYWCTADPGWVTGISYGLVAPLVAGATAVVDRLDFDADRWYAILENEQVEVWYTAPTAIRLLRRHGAHDVAPRRLRRLRHIASVGEPLDPEAVSWGRKAFGRPFHDTWWQTETGAIMIGNFPGSEPRPGSMGRPVPGIRAAIVRREGTAVVEVDEPNTVGLLALEAPWPSMFRDYRGEPARYREAFSGSWYLSGDLARRDENDYYWFVGRADDAIQSAGHLIGPFEIESVMMEHPAVTDAAAVGTPDAIAFETVAVILVLEKGLEASAELERELRAHARRRLGPAVAPRVFAYRDVLPRTPSGKILRRRLRDELAGSTGLPDAAASDSFPFPEGDPQR